MKVISGQLSFGFTLAVLSAILLILDSVAFVSGAESFPAFRLLQGSDGDKQFGSQRTAVNMLIGSGQAGGGVKAISELESSFFDASAETDSKRGLLVLLPEGFENATVMPKQEELEQWKKIEKEIFDQKIDIPVYFAYPGAHVQQVLSQLEGGDGDQLRIVVESSPSQPIAKMESKNIQAWLAGSQSGTEEKALPTIALVAHHDTFGVVPGLATGADDNASGVVAILELARIFSRLYSVGRTHGRYNLVFVITGAGKYNYQGARHWLHNTDARLLDTIELALCLDSIGSSGPLNLHVSRLPKSDNPVHMAFEKTAKRMPTIEFTPVHKKINLSRPAVDWEHEQFSRKRIFAGTLSRHNAPKSPEDRVNLFDRVVDVPTLSQNIRFVAESLARIVFDMDTDEALNCELNVFDGSLGIREDLVEKWMKWLGVSARHTPHTPIDSPILKAIESILHSFAAPVATQVFTLDKELTFGRAIYDISEVTMSVLHAQAMSFDILLLPLALAYLLAIYVIIKGVDASLDMGMAFLANLKEDFFSRNKKKR